MSFLDDFITIFAAGGSDDNNYLMKDQRDMVREHGNMGQQNLNQLEKNKNVQDTEVSMTSKDPVSGEEFAVDLRSDKGKAKSKKELEWIDREMTVTFTSFTNKDKFLTSTLGSLCNGKYANLASRPLREIASILSDNYSEIFNYVDSSIANYSERITPDQAFRIAKSISSQSRISLSDYNKIEAKLSEEHGQRFNDMLSGADIKIYYPIAMAVRDADVRRLANIETNKKSSIEVKKEDRRGKEVIYYLSYIKDFKEYKLGKVGELKPRVAAVLSTLNSEIKAKVTAEFKNDSILRNLA